MKSYPLHSTLEETGLIEQVKVAIDENVSSKALADLQDIDTLLLNDIIASKVEDAARLVILEAPYWLLGVGQTFPCPVRWEGSAGYGPGSIVLPDDWLRLVSFRMSDWSMGVTDAIDQSSPEYAMQRSRFVGVRGNPESPVVAIVQSGAGLVLEFYSCSMGPEVTVADARYLPVPKIDTNAGKIDLPDKLVPSIVYRIAAMTAESLGQGDLAAILIKNSNSLSEIVS